MLIGEYQHSVDPKGRVIIPSRFREELGIRFILTKGFDGCLYAYSMTGWEKVEQTLADLDFGGKDMRAFERWFFGGAVECEIDKQGRIIIPQNLREFAHLSKDVVIIGNRSKVEIWGKDEWEKYSQENHSCEEFAETMSGLRI